MPAPLRIVQIANLGNIGDNIYRVHQPCAALAQLPGVQVFEVHAESRHRDAAALAADVLVLTMTLDVEVFRLIHQRRRLGRLTVCEVNDYLPDVQISNPAHRTWADARGRYLFEQLMRHCDATQVSTTALGQRVAAHAQHLAVFENQLVDVPPLRQWPTHESTKEAGEATNDAPVAAPLVLGWGGSLGHLQDLQHIAPALTGWLQRHPLARLEIMADPSMAGVFDAVPRAQFQFHHAGSLAHYLQWLGTLDIGLAPLLPTPYNRCRSDVKFMEYAACGAVPVVQRLEPYASVRNGETGFVFGDPQHLCAILDRLAAAPALRTTVATAAHGYLRTHRRLEPHAHQRLDFYRQQMTRLQQSHSRAEAGASPATEGAFEIPEIPEPLTRAAHIPLLSLPNWQTLSPNHYRLDLVHPAEHQRVAGIQAMQLGDLALAAVQFAAAVRLDPTDATAYSLLGHCLLKQGRLDVARKALERAMVLDPLLSRPVRALARLHSALAQHYTQRASWLNPLPPAGLG